MKRLRLAAFAACLLLAGNAAAFAQELEEELPPQPLTHSAAYHAEAGDAVVAGDRAMVDFGLLQTVNPAIRGWLYQEETCLSQPILQGADDEYYRTHSLDDRYMPKYEGSVYMPANGDPHFDEAIIRLQGNGSASGPLALLADYATQDGYERAPALRLLTPYGDYLAEVFSVFPQTELPEAQNAAELAKALRALSLIQPIEGAEPAAGEKLLLLTVEGRGRQPLAVCAALRPITYQTGRTVDLNKADMDLRETQNGYATIEGVGTFMVYAQNDPLWDRLRYESGETGRYRRLGDGGCGPTAVALAVANLLAPERLPELRRYAATPAGTLFCEDSVNRYHCSHLHAPYQPKTAQEYLRYLPVILADFAAGNNMWDHNSRPADSYGTSMEFLDYVCRAYGIQLSFTRSADEALKWLGEKGGKRMAVACSIYGGPFTNKGHFLTLAGVDEAYFYVLDPLRRDDYTAWDRHGVVEVLQPGVLRIHREDAYLCNLSPFYLMETDGQE